MITMDLRVIIVLALVAPCYSWICGNRNQCVCSSNGMVSCDQISVSPLFPERSRNSRGLVLRVADPKTFDLNSLDLTHGFEFVSLTGADHDLCARVAAGFPWVTCKYDEVTSTSCVGPNWLFWPHLHFLESPGNERRLRTTNVRWPRDHKATIREATLLLKGDHGQSNGLLHHGDPRQTDDLLDCQELWILGHRLCWDICWPALCGNYPPYSEQKMSWGRRGPSLRCVSLQSLLQMLLCWPSAQTWSMSRTVTQEGPSSVQRRVNL